MRKHGKHARRSRAARRFGAVAAAGGAVALVATFPGSPAHASTIPGTGVSPSGDAAVRPEPGHPHLTAVAAQLSPSRYTIKSGDTLGAIATRFCGSGGKYPNLAASNSISNPDLILAGHWLGVSQRDCDHKPLVIQQPAVVTSDFTPSVTPRYHHHTYAAPRPAAAAPQYAGTYSFAGLEQLWVAAGGPAWAEAHAAEIAMCESGGRSDAYNPSGASGIWQILGQVVAGNIFDPMVNAENAVSKFKASGDTFAQWVCQ